VKSYFHEFTILTIDGVKVEFPDGWVHLRTSNTEPIMRIYAESTSDKKAQDYADKVINLINS
jgi:phosphomannomutase